MLVKVGPRGQITIPKKLRQELEINPGDSVTLVRQNGHFVVEPIRKSIFDFVGFIPPSDPPRTLEDMDQAIADEIVRDRLDA